MKKTILAIFVVTTSGCMQIEYDTLYSQVTISPSMSPEGKKTFRVIAHNQLPSFAKDMNLEDFHKSTISREMGRMNYCTNGYHVDYANANKSELVTIYEGTCQ